MITKYKLVRLPLLTFLVSTGKLSSASDDLLLCPPSHAELVLFVPSITNKISTVKSRPRLSTILILLINLLKNSGFLILLSQQQIQVIET